MGSPRRARIGIQHRRHSGMETTAALTIFLALCAAGAGTADAGEGGTAVRIEGQQGNHLFDYSPDRFLSSGATSEEKTMIRFASDFSVRFNLDHIILFVPPRSALLTLHAPAILEYFNGYGKFISIHSTSRPLLPRSIYHSGHRLGIALLWNSEIGGFFDQLSGLNVFDEFRWWLFIGRESPSETTIYDQVRDINLAIDSSAVVCRLVPRTAPTLAPGTTSTTTEADDSVVYQEGESVCGDHNRGEEWYEHICKSGYELQGRIKRQTEEGADVTVTLHQLYMLSRTNNRSLVQRYFGYWDAANGMRNVERLLPVERRKDLRGSTIIVGVRNSTGAGSPPPANVHPDGEDEYGDYVEVLFESLIYGINVSVEKTQFAKTGWRNEEGGWTQMLGAIVDGSIDLALETINVKIDVNNEMFFTHPIVKTMHNIYFKSPDSGGMRDIFLAPFSRNLLLSVFFTGVLLTLVMVSITAVNSKLTKTEGAHEADEERIWESDGNRSGEWEGSAAALWGVSVMCMQGSTWRPNTKSGSLLLISSLFFALVINNSYSAFITSVLSVKSISIKSLEDLIHSDFRFGYTLGTPDELLLRTVNDSFLRELYFKGLRENDGVNDPIKGMLRIGRGNYAFFVAARTGRRALQWNVAHSQRCRIQEFTVPVTKTVSSIAMSRKSPYRKLINFRVLRLMESGVLHRFQGLVLPSMPKCAEKTPFNSARLKDVYSGFYTLLLGWIVSGILLAGEVLDQRRRKMKRKPKNGQIQRTTDSDGRRPFPGKPFGRRAQGLDAMMKH